MAIICKATTTVWFVYLMMQAGYIQSTSVRLVGGNSTWEGRVELYQGSWGTVCDDDFGTPEAVVVCRMLGYNFGSPVAYSAAHFGQGQGTIWLDDLQCRGSESDLSYCSSRGWGVNDCHHTEDAGVNCFSGDIIIKLSGGRGNYEGIVEVAGGTICNKNFTDRDANVTCKMLGFNKGIATIGSKFGQLNTQIIYGNDFGCHGDEQALLLCPGFRRWERTSQCNQSMNAAVICDNTPVRLVDGSIPSEGRLEVKHNGVWGTVCGSSFDLPIADVFCKMLGLKRSGAVSFTQTAKGPIWLDGISCRGNESDIQFCNHTGWGNNTCDHSNDVFLRCAPTDVRLVDGAGPWEGSLEVLSGGQWRPTCDQTFGDEEANVICRMLGYTGRNAPHSIYHNNYFNHPSVSSNIEKIRCLGDEWDILQCYTDFNSTCDPINYTGLKCEGAQVRLVGGAHSSEGRVEIFHGGRWGSVCDEAWDNVDATVVCRMLASHPYDGEVNGTALPGPYFGHGTGPVWLSNVACNGSESGISSCKADWTGGINCDHGRDAGIICNFNRPKHLTNNLTDGALLELHQGNNLAYCKDNWTKKDANVICKELGFINPRVELSHIPPGSTGLNVIDPDCSGHEGHLEMCPMTVEYLQQQHCASQEAVVINCHPQDLKESLNIRLVDGPGPWMGRLEVLSNGVWGSFVHKSWSSTLTRIVCSSLGYRNSTASFYEAKHGLTSMLYNQVTCDHTFSNLGRCKMNYDISECSAHSCSAVGIDCSGGVDVTLTNDTTVSGKVEFHTKNQTEPWSVCYDGVNTQSATVICAMAGYPLLVRFGLDKYEVSEQQVRYIHGFYSRTTCGIEFKFSGLFLLSKGKIFKIINHKEITHDIAYAYFLPSAMKGLTFINSTPIVTRTSTQHRVLYSSIDCGGFESHVNQCNTSSNNTSCDDKAAISCLNCVFESRNMSGNMHSENYPSTYPPNKDCLFVIQTPQTTPIKLRFQDLQLAGDGDYIEIKDGPHGRQLGYFASSEKVPLLVSQNGSFYIRFQTNSNGNAKGFDISWSPLRIEDAVTMGCGKNGWNVAVNTTILRHLYPDTGVSQIKLSEQHCIGSMDGDLLIFSQSYSECSTQAKSTDTNVVYTNTLLYPEANSPFPLIVHGYRWKVDVECDIARSQTVNNNFHPNQTIIHQSPHVGSSSNYDTNIKFFTDGSFYKEITGNPVVLKTGNDVYVQVKMNSDDTLMKMVLDSCYAKPTKNADASMTYTLINNGCVKDSYTRIVSQGTHETRFVFNAFEFPTNHDSVFVYCNTTVCSVSDNSNACSQTCHSARPSIIG